MDYVIECAEQYFSTRFQKIHISAPVKLKGQFIRVFTELYKGEKQILSAEESIDEGLAIVYDQLVSIAYAQNRKDSEAENDTKKSILIMDCGGGTTDLASCEFSYRETHAGKTLELDTCFENGNSNFGGNNITYRIMQLLKIKIAAQLKPEAFPDGGEIIKLIDKSENDILSLVEEDAQAPDSVGNYDSDHANAGVYEKFLAAYQRAEEIIPTQYLKNGKFKATNQIKRIKRNFYYLWRRAEQAKIDFYRTERVLMDFDKTDADASFPIAISNEYLYTVNDNGVLSRNDRPFGNVSITIKEINRAICGDIYALLVGMFQDGRLDSGQKKIESFDYYKLSGQSCKISLFSELIKEYIPGRKLRPSGVKGANEKRGERETSEDLKLDCIRGCIYYNKDQMRPEMSVRIRARRPEIIYTVKVKGQHTGDKILLDRNTLDAIGMAVCPKNTQEVPLRVIGKNGIVERDFVVPLIDSEQEPDVWSEEEIKNQIEHMGGVPKGAAEKFIRRFRSQVESDKTREGENIMVAFPAKDEYGFYFMQIFTQYSGDCNLYKVLYLEYENFEDASKTFFDGKR